MEHIKHLSKDSKLKKVITGQDPVVLEKSRNLYLVLCGSIISQQLSTRVAAVIYGRFLDLYPRKKPTPQQVIDTPFDTLRSIGLSNAKTSYVQHVSRFFLEENVTTAKLNKMDNEAVIEYFTRIKGVGRWTVEMIMMFSLGREDVFAVDDLGIQQACCRLYGIDPTDKKGMKEEMLRVSAKWSPYRTYACRYLWRWKDQ